jgi:hypothetical protein
VITGAVFKNHDVVPGAIGKFVQGINITKRTAKVRSRTIRHFRNCPTTAVRRKMTTVFTYGVNRVMARPGFEATENGSIPTSRENPAG